MEYLPTQVDQTSGLLSLEVLFKYNTTLYSERPPPIMDEYVYYTNYKGKHLFVIKKNPL